MKTRLLVLIVFLVGSATVQAAEESKDSKVRAATEQASLITGYDEVLWYEDLLQGRENKLGIYSSLNARYIKNAYPWMYPLIYPDKQVAPRKTAKWNRDVSISFDYPDRLQPAPTVIGTHNVRSFHPYNTDVDVLFKAIVRDAVLSALPDIETSTGLRIPFEENEEKGNPSPIRIVLLHNAPWENAYKSGGSARRTGGTGPVIESVENNYSAKVSFTPDLLTQVSGYFVVGAEGDIQFAVCKLSSELPLEIIEPIVKECLLRVMGLPSVQTRENESLLTVWNYSAPARDALKSYVQSKSGIPPFDQAVLRRLYKRPD